MTYTAPEKKDPGMNVLKIIGATVLFVAAIVALTMGGNALGLWQLEVFGARTEAVRNNIYKHSTAHVEGEVHAIRRYQVEYLAATDDASKSAIASLIIREADDISDDELPADLSRFVSDLRSHQ